jgi:hypothetical protein
MKKKAPFLTGLESGVDDSYARQMSYNLIPQMMHVIPAGENIIIC